MVYIASGKRELIFDAVRTMYTAIARDPAGAYHVPVGRDACTFVGYPDAAIRGIPPSSVESFAGVGYPFAANVIGAGDLVLDLGAGSGTDVWLAAQAAGPSGRVVALDLTPAMLEKLEAFTRANRVSNVQIVQGNAEQLPLPDASIDVVTTNGVLNLVPDKRRAFEEIWRVLRPGGRLQAADIAVGRPLEGDCLSNPQLWAECIVGATPEDEYLRMLVDAGLRQVETIGRLDYFSASTNAETVSIARSFNACSIVVRAAKPPAAALPGPLPWPPSRQRSNAADVVPALPVPDAVLDGSGQLCGTLEPAMRMRMRGLVSGQVLEVRADDPAARLGVPAWSRLAGHALLATIEEDARRTRFLLRKR